MKFSPDGKVLLRLGMPGMTGDGSDALQSAIGRHHGDERRHLRGRRPRRRDQRANREIRQDRQVHQGMGTRGAARGQLDAPHALAMDSKGRLFVADRANNRIQIFDQNGTELDAWRQFSRPSGVYIDKNDVIYVADSESNKSRKHGEWKRGIRIGSARDGKVTAFIPDDNPNVDEAPLRGRAAQKVSRLTRRATCTAQRWGRRGLRNTCGNSRRVTESRV